MSLPLQLGFPAYANGMSGVCLWIGEGIREEMKKERQGIYSTNGRY
jgi:hypothetical protein